MKLRHVSEPSELPCEINVRLLCLHVSGAKAGALAGVPISANGALLLRLSPPGGNPSESGRFLLRMQAREAAGAPFPPSD